MVAPARMVIGVRASERVRKGVNAKSDVKNQEHAKDNREHHGSHWMSNGQSGCKGCDDTGPDCPRLIMTVLRHGKPIVHKILDVRVIDHVLPEKDPSHVRIPKTMLDVVWIGGGIHQLMVAAMQGGPLERRLLEAGSAEEKEEETNWRARPKRGMSEQTVIADGNRKSRRQHINAEDRPFGC